jgi:hypothetical protein
MPGFLSAHGYDPGPTQRPVLAGLAAGLVATAPGTAILLLFHAIRVEAAILGRPAAGVIVGGCVVMSVAGAAYGRLFQRAANDRRGGWLFGMAFGFLLWAAGAVMALPLVSGGLAPGGRPAMGMLLALLTWGIALGACFPFIHRRLHLTLRAGVEAPGEIGPGAAAFGKKQFEQRPSSARAKA